MAIRLATLGKTLGELGKDVGKQLGREVGKPLSQAVKAIPQISHTDFSKTGFFRQEDFCRNLTAGAEKHSPRENGHWEGERGDSKWRPDKDYIPGKCNPEQRTWGEILKSYNVDGIDFKDGEPDFSPMAKAEVKIDERSDDRGVVFNQADIKTAQERGCQPWEVTRWRQENGYTWHEKSDGLTVQKVPSEVHGNISHQGGHSKNVKELEA